MLFTRPLLLIAFAMLPSASFASQPPAESNCRWATFKNVAGENYFALSLQATQDLPSASQVEVVVIVDTSASQTGPIRLESIEVLNELAANLPLNAKVSLLASDVQSVDLSGGLVAATDSKWESAVARLQKRIPLGTTDLTLALRTALSQFSTTSAQRTIVYIGDGLNRSHLLTAEEHRQLIDDLVKRQVSVSSLAIGPVVDVANLAALANNTGGILLSREEIEESTQAIGRVLGSSVSLPVIWPTSVDAPKALATFYPSKFPPLRVDRDSVILGQSLTAPEAGKINIRGTSGGKEVTLTWAIKPEESNPDLGFLPTVIESAKLDAGINLPALGSAGLRAMSFALADTATELVKAGQFALKSGETANAKRIAEEALKSDPNNAEATSLLNAAKKLLESVPAGKFMQTRVPVGDDPFAEPTTPAEPAVGADPFGAPPAQIPGTPSEAVPSPLSSAPLNSNPVDGAPALLDDSIGDGSLLAREEELRRAAAQAINQNIRQELSEATKLMRTDPAGVKNALKARLEEIDAAVDLDPAVRADLRNKLQSAIRTAAVEEGRYLDRVERAEALSAQADASQRLLAEVNRTDESVKQLVEQFNYLIAQRKYLEASKDIAPEVGRLLPGSPIENTIREQSSLLANYSLLREVYERREQGLVDAFRGVEAAAVPIDEPTIIYPPAEVWQALSARRKERYGAINLAGGAGGSKAEQKITTALKQVTKDIDYQGTPLRQVMQELQDTYNIPIRLNTVELGVVGIDPESPITITLPSEISLRSALRQILASVENADAGLTYTIRDEVLLITSTDDADKEPQIKVYQVGDLVVTPQMLQMSGGGGMGGGMGGMGGGMGGMGMGGGMGGMGGGMGGMGMGGMGGGMGGMGGGMGGMGGMFVVPDDSAKKSPKEAPKAIPKHRASAETLTDVQSLIARYAKATEEERKKLDAEVEALVESRVNSANGLYTAKKTAEAQAEFQQVIEIVGSLLGAGYPQAWMYQALSLSMEACEYPAADIKRLMLSGLDFDGSPNEAVRIAKHFIRKGMKKEALDLLHDVSKVEPYRYDIFALALPLATELKDTDSLKWVCLGVLSKAWPKAQSQLFDEANVAARATAIRLAQSGRIVESKAFEEAMKSAMLRDIVVRINWTGDADLDIRVREPAGTICSLKNPQSIGGGVLLGDTSSVSESAKVGGFSEYYVCSQGFAGQYDILVRRVWGEVTGGKATVEIYTDYGTEDQQLIVKQLDLSEKDSLIQVAVKNGHRKEPIAAAEIAQAQKQRVEASRAVLGQFGGNSSSSSSNSNFATMQQFRQLVASNNRFGFPIRGAVGYRPVITTLPQGARFQVAGVVSADRRYVRIAPTPFFTDIGQVTTFNFVAGTSGTSGGGQQGGGFGGGGIGQQGGGGGGIL